MLVTQNKPGLSKSSVTFSTQMVGSQTNSLIRYAKMYYTKATTEWLPWTYYVLGAVAAVIIILIAACICCCVKCRKPTENAKVNIEMVRKIDMVGFGGAGPDMRRSYDDDRD
jgi:hypothetical protein